MSDVSKARRKDSKPEDEVRSQGNQGLRKAMRYEKKKLIIFGTSTVSGVVAAVIVLIAVNASFLKIPDSPPARATSAPRTATPTQLAVIAEPDYKAITERNLFRAKLQVEIPKPKTEKEIEEEALTAIVKTMALKGVMLSPRKRDNYAVIDLGRQKGVWVYEPGDVIEKGLTVKEIGKDSVRIEKDEFRAVLKLFSSANELARTRRTTGVAAARPAIGKLNPGKEIRREGSVTRISKSLAERLKADNSMIMSAVAVKPSPEGVKVVAVDKGSIAQQMGIAPNDTLQEVNGHKLGSTEDMSTVYDSLKNATDFEVKVLRGGQPATLRYQIR
jgi:general secretion pathway protein C